MKKTLVLVTFIILTLISSIFAINTHENQIYKTQLADQIFMGSLSQAQTGFAMDYSKMNDDEKVYYYMQISSNLGTAINIIDLTSYNNLKNRNELFDAIYSLNCCMTRSASREKVLTKESASVYKYLLEIIKNPEDKKDCQALTKLIEGTYPNRTK